MPAPPPPARPAGTPAAGHRPYSRADYRYLATHYRHYPAPVLARALGRTPGSVYAFVAKHLSCASRGGPDEAQGSKLLHYPD